MELKGKKAFCFLALKHHSRFLLPITRALEAEGMKITYLTAPAEMPFELTLNEAGLPYVHTQSYMSHELAAELEAYYKQVRSAWREKILQSLILHHFTLPVQDKVLRTQVENFYLFRRMFEVEKPDLVLALHELNSWGKTLGYLSNEFGVPFVTLQEGLYYAPAEIYRFHTEYSTACLVWGEATREVLINSGGCGDKIFVVGNTHLHSAISEATEPSIMKNTREELRTGIETKVVTLLMGGLGYDESFTFPEELLAWVRNTPDLTLVCKWHPVTHKIVLEKIWERTEGACNVRFLQHFDTYRLLAVSDICVLFGNSTTGLESLAFGRPLVEIVLPGQDYSFAAQGVADGVHGLAEVPSGVRRIWKQGLAEERQRKVKDYLRRNLYVMDGRSVERATDVIESVISARADRDRLSPVAVLSPAKRRDFLCSVIIPYSSSSEVTETLIGVAQHTSAYLPYECLISTAKPEDVHEIVGAVNGDMRLVLSNREGVSSLCNRAAVQAKGLYLCFLRPGLIPQQGWLQALLKEIETQKKAAAVGSRIVFPDGLLAHAGIAFDANLSAAPLYRLLPADFAGANQKRPVRAVSDCLLVRREAFEVLGGFDEAFSLGWHELDFCLRAGLGGWLVVYTPHSLLLNPGEKDTQHEGDRLRFYGKWVGHLWPDEELYWKKDGLDHQKLSTLYGRLAPSFCPDQNQLMN
ncbi:MAG: hypothetical protein HY695_02345 [Deltaproteobacteria bacterium]|nr:hypothetical protein [Deltaproteobacteria bacterium]